MTRGLRHVAVAATGYENVDTDAARNKGVLVTNTRGYASASVAEHVLLLILALEAFSS